MMPQAVIKTGLRYFGIYVLISGAIASLAAADLDTAIRTTEGAAERWGLWAVLALGMVAASMYALWKQTMFVQGRFLDIMEEQIVTNRQVRDAIRHAPCGVGVPDSDGQDNPEITPTRALAAVERRKARQQKREGEQ